MSDQRESFRYKAFLSYSQSADKALAPALQSGLQRITASWRQLRAIHVYRDETDIPTTSALMPRIKDALRQSEFFILLASPRAAVSPWVQIEVEYWLSLNPIEKFLIVLTEGKQPVWDQAAGDFLWEKDTSLPSALKNKFKDQPKFTDLRWAREKKTLRLRDQLFYEVVADLASTLRGVDKSTLVGEDARQLRKNRRLASSAVVALLILTLAASAAAVVAFNQRNNARANAEEANRQRGIAKANEATATTNELRAKEQEGIATSNATEAKHQQGIAETNAVEAKKQQEIADQQRAKAEDETRKAIRELSLRNWQQAVADRQSNDYMGAAHYFARSGQISVDALSVQNSMQEVQHYTRSFSLTFEAQHQNTVNGTAFTRDGSVMLSWIDGEARLWRVADSSPVGARLIQSGLDGALFSPDEASVLTWGRDGTVRLWNARDGSVKRIDSMAHRKDDGELAQVYGAIFSPNGSKILSWGSDGAVRLWNAKDGTPAGPAMYAGEVVNLLPGEDEGDLKHKTKIERYSVTGATFIEGGRQILSWGYDGYVRLWDAQSCKAAVQPMAMGRDADDERIAAIVSGVAYAPKKRLILAWGGTNVARVWHAEDGVQLFSMEHDGRSRISNAKLFLKTATFSLDEERVLTVGEDGMAKLWNVANGSEIGEPIPAGSQDTAEAAFSEDGKSFITGRIGLSLWRSADGRRIRSEFENSNLNGEAISADGHQMIAWQNDGKINVISFTRDSFNEYSCCITKTLDHGEALKTTSSSVDKAIRGAVLSRDTNYVLSWTARTARLWDTRTGMPVTPLFYHESDIAGATLANDNRHIVTWTQYGRVRIWTVNTENPFPAEVSVGSAATQPLYWTGEKNETTSLWLSIWVKEKSDFLRTLPTGISVTLGQLLKRYGDKLLPYADGQKRIGDISTDERMVIAWDKSGASLHRTVNGELIRPLVRCQYANGGAKFSDDGTMILSWCSGKGAQLEQTQGNSPPIPLNDPGVTSAVLSHNNEYVMTMDQKHDVYLWSRRHGVWTSQPLAEKGLRPTHALEFSPDSQRALTTDGGFFYLWRTRDGALVGKPFPGTKDENDPAFSPDGKFILTSTGIFGSPLGVYRTFSYTLWHASDGTFAYNLDSRDGVKIPSPAKWEKTVSGGAAFSKSGTLLVTWLGSGARLWITATGTQAFPTLLSGEHITEAFFSEDERLLFIGNQSADSTLTTSIWHTFDGSPAVERVTGSAINGRNFGRKERFLVTDGWRTYAWELGVNQGLRQQYLSLYVEVMTGTTLDERGSVAFLSVEQWLRKRRELASKVGGSFRYEQSPFSASR